MQNIPHDIDLLATVLVHENINPPLNIGDDIGPLRRAIAAAVLAERERCAKIADDYAKEAWGCTEEIAAAEGIAALIRA